jgi:hypothetical protein
MIVYIIKTIWCSAILLLVYRFFLEKEKMHRLNRFYLISSIVLSYTVPLITFHSNLPSLPVQEILLVDLPNAATTAPVRTPVAIGINWWTSLFVLYGCITLFLLVRFARNIIALLLKAKNNVTVNYAGVKLVLIKDGFVPHSFFNYIFLGKQDFDNGVIEEEIFCHELAHVQQKHSADIVFYELLLAFAWFNPVLWFYRRAIQLNHEFLADDAVVKKFNNTPGYQHLLLSRAHQGGRLLLASRFNYLITKKRLVMMSTTTSRNMAALKQLALLPVLCLVVFGFSNRVFAQTPPQVVPTPPAVSKIEASANGASPQLLQEFKTIVDKYGLDHGGGGKKFYETITTTDRNRLETIFKLMSREQQGQQIVGFMPPPAPFAKAIPSQQQIATWKDSKKYGVWIDNKRVSNEVLDDYSNEDFAHFFESKLSKNAINYGKHYYQANLMTKNGYQEYYKKASANKINIIWVRWNKKDANLRWDGTLHVAK